MLHQQKDCSMLYIRFYRLYLHMQREQQVVQNSTHGKQSLRSFLLEELTQLCTSYV